MIEDKKIQEKYNKNREQMNKLLKENLELRKKLPTKEEKLQSKIEKALKHITTMQEEYIRKSDVSHDLIQLERILK